LSIGQSAADADFAITAGFHACQRVLDPGDGLTLPEVHRVVDERDAVDNSNQLLGNLFGLDVVEQDFVALVQEDPRVMATRSPFSACRPSLSLFQQLESLRLHQ
jgi:hypothetical protein